MANGLYNDQDLLVLVDSGTPNLAVDQDLAVLVTQRLVPALIHLDVNQDLMILVQRLSYSVNVNGHWEDAGGNPIANGTLYIRLNTDALIPNTNSQLDTRWRGTTLDANGNIPAGLRLFPNSLLVADYTTFYEGRVDTAQGLNCWSGQFIVTTADPFTIY